MITVTWPYGTTRRGRVIHSFASIGARGMLVECERGEGHVLLGDAGDISAGIGDYGTLTFTEGGPTGGYWKFTKDETCA